MLKYLSIALLLIGSRASAAECKAQRIVDFPVTMNGYQPETKAKINGTEVSFVVDSGAFYSMISPDSAAELHLPLKSAPLGVRSIEGVNGEAAVSLTTVKSLMVGNVEFPKVDFLVGGSHAGAGSVGVLAQNFLQRNDVEYDFATGTIRLYRVKDCAKANLAYWVKPGQAYSELEIHVTTPSEPHAVGAAYVNGRKIRVLFDTGAGRSMLSLRAAEEAGVTPKTPGTTDAGDMYGFGRKMSHLWIAPFSSFKLGDEEIRNTRLPIGTIDLQLFDMLLGADFFLSHHVFISNSQSKVFFTYNGGAVFDLSASTSKHTEAPTAGTVVRDDNARDVGQMTDAAELSRRGASSASRQDYTHALADLTRAIELAPTEPNYLYERALVYERTRQSDLALADLNRVIELAHDHVPGLLARAELQIEAKNSAAAAADLDTVNHVAAKEADARLRIAAAYEKIGNGSNAIDNLDKWITSHPDDARLSAALFRRCSASANFNEDLKKGLEDCDTVISSTKANESAAIRAIRGLIRFRQSEYTKAVDDFDASLKVTPKAAWVLYARGVAKLRLGKTPEGQADITVASALHPKVAEEYKNINIVP